MDKYTITCPCCEATLNVDAATGVLLSHDEKKKPMGSFEDLQGELEKQRQIREQIFSQEMSSMKDRERLPGREVSRGNEAGRYQRRHTLQEPAGS